MGFIGGLLIGLILGALLGITAAAIVAYGSAVAAERRERDALEQDADWTEVDQ